MQVFIQGVPERKENIDKIISSFKKTKVELNLDPEKDLRQVTSFATNCNSFIKIIGASCDDYKLVLQDDVILPPMFEDYLPELERIMFEQRIDILSLFVPRQLFFLNNHYTNGETIVELSLKTFGGWTQAMIYSPFACKLINEFAPSYDKIDTYSHFLYHFMEAHNINPHIHLPSLVQHDTSIPGTYPGGCNSSIMHTSALFDPRYIELKLSGEPERKRFHPDGFGKIKKKIWPWENHMKLYFLEQHYDLVTQHI